MYFLHLFIGEQENLLNLQKNGGYFLARHLGHLTNKCTFYI